jgi:transcriptional regulator with XRE-family HTH domain
MDFNVNRVIITQNYKLVNCKRVKITVLQCPIIMEIGVIFIYMTHFQELFIENLRFFRKKRGISQLKFSEMVNLSPNYLNAVENGKNFPSPEVIQQIADTLKVLPYQLFLEHPVETARLRPNIVVSELIRIRQQFVKDIGDLIKKCEEKITLKT